MEEIYALHSVHSGTAPSAAPPGRPPGKPLRLLAPIAESLRSAPVSDILPSLVRRNAAERIFADALRGAPPPADDPAVEHLVRLLDTDTGGGFEALACELEARGDDPQETARLLLEPAARSIGAAWCADTQDFVRVTFAVSRLQRLFWRLAANCPPRPSGRAAKLALLAPAPGEQHTFGLSVVEDALRRSGWEVDCCRFGEAAEMFRLVARNHYSFVGLSLGSEALLPAFASAIGTLRSRSRNPSIAVMAGGSLFRERPELAIGAGADLVAADARSVCRMADEIVRESAPCERCVAAE